MNFLDNNTSLNTILLLGTMVSVVAYVVFSVVKGSGKASKESNDILRGLVEDQKNEILKIRERAHDTTNELQAVKLQVQHITDKRDYLEKLVNLALIEFFAKDATIAKAVKENLRSHSLDERKET